MSRALLAPKTCRAPFTQAGRSCHNAPVNMPRGMPSRTVSAVSTRRGLVAGLSLVMSTLNIQRGIATAAVASPIEQVLEDPKWPVKFPFKPEDFRRYDESSDKEFYSYPRLVTHIDDKAIKALTKHYSEVFPPSGNDQVAVLDICSSWVSHYPEGFKAGRVAGLGMNADELSQNKQLTEFVVKDLNEDPKLPFPDNTFDILTNCVSVDYLTQPLEVFREIHRVLKPGGTAIMSFSNRCFPTKAIGIWTATSDLDHVWIVGSYFHYSVVGGFTDPKCKDISPNPGRSDPMYVVYASKKATA